MAARESDINFDLKRGFLTLHDRTLDLPTTASVKTMLLVPLMKNGAMCGSFLFCWKRGTFHLTKTGVVQVFLMSVHQLQATMDAFGIDAQIGFCPDRGTIDGFLAFCYARRTLQM